jgi:glycerol-3-phosphate acyltransferase PlsY
MVVISISNGMIANMSTPTIGLVIPLLAYLAGAIPFGLLVVRMAGGTDIRRSGSGNIGATNVSRLAGYRWALVTLVLDIAKGAIPTWVALHLSAPDGLQWLPAVTVLAAVCGHMYPIYLKLQASGKGVATAGGGFAVAAPLACVVALLIFTATVRWSRRVSVGSLAATFILPPAIWFSSHNTALTLCGIAVMVLIIYRHKENLQRLAHGEEPPWRRTEHPHLNK